MEIAKCIDHTVMFRYSLRSNECCWYIWTS